MTRRGFPHSDICVSTPACGSTQLIAANHVLHRLLTPRHPPSALSSLTTSLSDPFQDPCGVKAKVRFSRMSCFFFPLRLSESRTRIAVAYDRDPKMEIHVDTIFALRPAIQLSISYLWAWLDLN